MRGILINPFDETVKEVNILGNIEDIYLLTECRTFDVVALSDKDDLYIDDEGLLKDNSMVAIKIVAADITFLNVMATAAIGFS